jgi:hypothetical protein
VLDVSFWPNRVFVPLGNDGLPILGMNVLAPLPPGKLVGVIHAGGQDAFVEFVDEHADELKRCLGDSHNLKDQERRTMSDDNTQDGAEPSLASAGSHGSPAAWGVMRVGGRWVSILGNYEQAETSRKSFDAMENWVHVVRPLYEFPQPMLADEERAALGASVRYWDGPFRPHPHAAVLRKLIERLK